MKRILTAFLAVGAILVTSSPLLLGQHEPRKQRLPAATEQRNPAQIVRQAEPAMVLIVASSPNSTNLGTGFVVRGSKIVISNFHVVEGAKTILLKLPDGRDKVVDAAVGYDLANDLVALSAEVDANVGIPLGDSDNVQVGDSVIVISNPEGLERTVSAGLISGIRDIGGRRLFQISAPISHGSSGGAVFNTKGEVIAVAVGSIVDGQNLNFAVPINFAKPLLSSTSSFKITSLPVRQHGANNRDAAPPATAAFVPDRKTIMEAMRKTGDRLKSCEPSVINVLQSSNGESWGKFWSSAPSDLSYEPGNDGVFVIEFSVFTYATFRHRTRQEAEESWDPDPTFLSLAKVAGTSPQRHRHVFRVKERSVELEEAYIYSTSHSRWELEVGKTGCAEE